MKKTIFLLLILIPVFAFSQDYRKIDWKTNVTNLEYISVDTFKFEAEPIDYNDVGATTREMGNYFIDYVARCFKIIDHDATTITVVDLERQNTAPQSNQIGRVYKSIIDADTSFLSVGGVDISVLDELSKWKDVARNNELFGRAISQIRSEIPDVGGLLTSETDPVFGASAAKNITPANITNWNNKADTTGQTTNFIIKKGVKGQVNSTIYDNGTKVGIGTINPAYGFDVETGAIKINNNITGAGSSGTIYLGDGSFSKSYGSAWYFAGGISTNSTLYGSVLYSSVGTGTSPLSVSSTTLVSNLNADYLDGQHGSYYALASIYPSTGLTTGYLPYKTATNLSNSPVWTDATNVKIGTFAVVNSNFDINGAKNTDFLSLRASLENVGDYTGIRLGGHSTASYGAYIRAVKTTALGGYWNNDLTFLVTRKNTTTTIDEVLRITSDSKVGIGLTTPTEKLEVNGDIKADSIEGFLKNENDPKYKTDSSFIKTGVRSWNSSLAKTIDAADTTRWGNDNSPTNEIQTISLVVDSVHLSKGGGSIKLPAETDPIFSASLAATIDSNDIARWESITWNLTPDSINNLPPDTVGVSVFRLNLKNTGARFQSNGPQLHLDYNDTTYTSIMNDSAGVLNIMPSGGVVAVAGHLNTEGGLYHRGNRYLIDNDEIGKCGIAGQVKTSTGPNTPAVWSYISGVVSDTDQIDTFYYDNTTGDVVLTQDAVDYTANVGFANATKGGILTKEDWNSFAHERLVGLSYAPATNQIIFGTVEDVGGGMTASRSYWVGLPIGTAIQDGLLSKANFTKFGQYIEDSTMIKSSVNSWNSSLAKTIDTADTTRWGDKVKNLTLSTHLDTLIATLETRYKTIITKTSIGCVNTIDQESDRYKIDTFYYDTETGDVVLTQDAVDYTAHITETDPIFSASVAAEIDSVDIERWNLNKGTPALGSYFQGGDVFYISHDETWGLCATQTTIASNVPWSLTKTNISGANALTIGSGNANTVAIVANQGSGNYAAKLCSDYTFGGYSDWYLPSLTEIDSIFRILKQDHSIAYPDDNVWSSSQVPPDPTSDAGMHNMQTTIMSADKTGVTANVIAVRTFQITGTITGVTATAPIVSSGGTVPDISIAAANTTTNGYLSYSNWNTFNNKQAALVSGTNIKTVNGNSLLGSGNITLGGSGTVTSVGMTVPTGLSISGTPITSSGTFALSLTSGYAIPTTANQTTWTNKQAAYTNLTTFGNLSNSTGYLYNNGSGTLSYATPGGSGTVTSVAMTVPTGLSISGTPITSSGTLAVSLTSGYSIPTTANQTTWTNKQAAYTNLTTFGNLSNSTGYLYNNGSGTLSYATPGGSGTVTSVAMTVPTGLSISGTPITSSGTLAVSLESGYSIPTTTNQTTWTNKQEALVSGTNIKTINGNSLLGSGNLTISGSSQWTTDTYGLNYSSGNIAVGTESSSEARIHGFSTSSVTGVAGGSVSGYGVSGNSTNSIGVHGNSDNGVGVSGSSAYSYGGEFSGLGVNVAVGKLYIAETARINSDGSYSPPSLTDAAALNHSTYYSTTQGKLCYKDPSGTVHALY